MTPKSEKIMKKDYDEPRDHTDDELEEGRTIPFQEPESTEETDEVF